MTQHHTGTAHLPHALIGHANHRHLGNYAGAIRPAIVASRDLNADSFYFLADYHALIK